MYLHSNIVFRAGDFHAQQTVFITNMRLPFIRKCQGVFKSSLIFPCRNGKKNPLYQFSHRTFESLAIQTGHLGLLSEEEQMMKDTVSKLAREKFQPLVRKMDEESKLDPSITKALFENGLMAIDADSHYGGSGSSFFSVVLAIEELAKVDPVISLFVDLQNTLITKMVYNYGTQELKDKYMPMFCKGSIGAFCLSEPESGSDAFALKTHAVRSVDDFVINGTKMWITNADVAEVYYVMANAEPTKGYKGITCFMVDRDTPGVSVGKKERKLGLRASGTCTVNFDNVRVPKTQLLGEFGKGYKYAIGMLNEGRIGVAAQMLGLAEGCFQHTLDYTFDRKQFGKRIFDFQGMQFQLSHMASQLEASRLLVYNAARMKEQGLNFVKEAAIAKYFVSEMACTVTSKCIDLMGGVGFTQDFPIEKYYRDCKAGTIYEGTSNIQLNTIAKCLVDESQK